MSSLSGFNLQKWIAQLSTHPQVKNVLSRLNQSEKKFHSEVNKALVSAKKSVTELEKNLELYRKKVLKQKNEIEKLLRSKLKTSKKKTTARKTTKKATKKTSTKKTVTSA